MPKKSRWEATRAQVHQLCWLTLTLAPRDKIIPPPGAVVTGRRMLVDPRTEALYGERVPYIISKGIAGPSMKQALRALTPEEFLADRYAAGR